MQGNIVAIHNVLKKNCIAKFSTSSIFKKIGKDNLKKTKKKRSQFQKKKTCKKKGGTKAKKKNMWGKLLCVVETLQQSTMLFLKKLRN